MMKTKLIIIKLCLFIFYVILSICQAETTTAYRIDPLKLTATKVYKNNPATGTAYFYFPTENETFYKPVIFVENEDIIKEKSQDELYTRCNQQNLIDSFLNNYQTVILIDFDDTLDYIQNNAYLLIDFIKEIQKKSNNNLLSIIGLSSGGMIARYALTYMENQSIPHIVRLMITIDTPHQGGNVPLGLQHWIDFFKDQSKEAQEKLNRLNKPLPKQMLYYYYSETDDVTANSYPEKYSLSNELKSIGNYPKNLRKVAISNGSGNGEKLTLIADNQLIKFKYGNAWALAESNNSNQIFFGEIPFPDKQKQVKITNGELYDVAPGSLLNTCEEIAEFKTNYGDISTENPYHSYVSTISALDIENSDILSEIHLKPKTPFDKIYSAEHNQSHLFISKEFANIIYSEVIRKLSLEDVIKLLKILSSCNSE